VSGEVEVRIVGTCGRCGSGFDYPLRFAADNAFQLTSAQSVECRCHRWRFEVQASGDGFVCVEQVVGADGNGERG
jgi:hypothetical protein